VINLVSDIPSLLANKWATQSIADFDRSDLVTDIGTIQAQPQSHATLMYLFELLKTYDQLQGPDPIVDGSGSIYTLTITDPAAAGTIQPADGDVWQIHSVRFDNNDPVQNAEVTLNWNDGSSTLELAKQTVTAESEANVDLQAKVIGDLIISQDLFLSVVVSGLAGGTNCKVLAAYHKVVG
jgi:hypothetical protein